MALDILSVLKGGKSKGSSLPSAGADVTEAPPSSSEEGGGSESEYADMVFDAFQDGDKESFTKALIGVVKACIAKEDAAETGG